VTQRSPFPLLLGLRAKIADWPEFRMGVHRLGIVLRNGSTVHEVFVSGGLVRGIGRTDEGLGAITFGVDEVTDVLDESGWLGAFLSERSGASVRSSRQPGPNSLGSSGVP
jgi:hypothetical protein